MNQRWTGGASVRLRKVGMLSVPKPFATLTLEQGLARLTVRPVGYTRRLPGFPWLLSSEDSAEVFPVRATGFKRGVGFERPGERPYYFWCGRAREAVLDALEEAGYLVIRAERRPEYR